MSGDVKYTGPDRREFHGIRDKVNQGKMSVEVARSRQWMTDKSLLDIPDVAPLDPHVEASKMKASGTTRDWSWSRWIQLTGLRPGMDAKDWYKIYDEV